MTRIAFLCQLCIGLVVVSSIPLFSAEITDWQPEDQVPQFSYVGFVSPAEQRAANALRAHIVRGLTYWKARGLPKPALLDQLVYIPTYEGVRLQELIRVLNPDIPDVEAHLARQYTHFQGSVLFQSLKNAEEKNSLPAGTLAHRFFDKYASQRYGFEVKNFVHNFRENPLMTDLDMAEETELMSDNAYFSRFVKVDLTDALPLAQQKIDKLIHLLAYLVGGADFGLLTETSAQTVKARVARRIVILPRMTEQRGEVGISTLQDHSVGAHEHGHHINSGLGEIPSMVNEALADYLAAAPVDNPKIGEFFAKASGEVARRLESSPHISDRYLAKSLAQLAAKGVLRDLSVVTKMDELPRKRLLANDYTAGHPIRSLLWLLRNDSAVDQGVFENVVLHSIVELSSLPRIISDESAFVLSFRHLIRELKTSVLSQSISNQLLKRGQQKGEETISEEELPYRTKEMVGEQLSKLERATISHRAERRRNGGGSRPPILADYIVPEYFRALYRVAFAMKEFTLCERIAFHAGEVMNANPVIITTDSGARELVFAIRAIDGDVRENLSTIMNNLELLRAQYGKLLQVIHNEKVFDRMWKKGDELYGDNLARLQEYERSGQAYRLNDPHPHAMRLRMLAAQLSANCATALQQAGDGQGG